MPVPTEAAAAATDERVPASPSERAPAQPAETVSSGGEEESTSPVGSLSECRGTDLEGSGEEKPATKLFIGGLNWQTTAETLKEFFETHYGEVVECSIMKDQATKKSRGFGFITFTKTETVDKVLQAHKLEPICVDNKQIDPKIAVPPKKASNHVTPQVHVKRIFVGGLSSETTDTDMRDYFEQFGEVTEVQLMFDRNTNRLRGFGFVSFKEEEPADKVCSIQFHDIRGKKVEVKVAQSKEEMQSKIRNISNPPPGPSYGYPMASFGPYYHHGNYHYDMTMGYVPGPVMYPLKMRGVRRDFHGPTYYGGFMDQRAQPAMHGYYAAAGPGYGGIPMPAQMMRGGPHYIDHPQVIHNMEYVAEHFQGLALGSGGTRGAAYTNGSHSPPYSQSYDGSSGGGYEGGSNGSSSSSSGSGSYSPTHNNSSPTGTGPPAVNRYAQVPTFTGSPPSTYAVSY